MVIVRQALPIATISQASVRVPSLSRGVRHNKLNKFVTLWAIVRQVRLSRRSPRPQSGTLLCSGDSAGVLAGNVCVTAFISPRTRPATCRERVRKRAGRLRDFRISKSRHTSKVDRPFMDHVIRIQTRQMLPARRLRQWACRS